MKTEDPISRPSEEADADLKSEITCKTTANLKTSDPSSEPLFEPNYPRFMQFLQIQDTKQTILAEKLGDAELSLGEQGSISKELNEIIKRHFEEKDIPAGQLYEENSSLQNKTWMVYRNSKDWEFYLLSGDKQYSSEIKTFFQQLVKYFDGLEKKLGFSEEDIRNRIEQLLEPFLAFFAGTQSENEKVNKLNRKVNELFEQIQEIKTKHSLTMDNTETVDRISENLITEAKLIQEKDNEIKDSSGTGNVVLTIILLVAGGLFLMAVFGALYLQLRVNQGKRMKSGMGGGLFSTSFMDTKGHLKFKNPQQKKEYFRFKKIEKQMVDKMIKKKVKKMLSSQAHKLKNERIKHQKSVTIEHQILKRIHKKNLAMLKRIIQEHKNRDRRLKHQKMKRKNRSRIEFGKVNRHPFMRRTISKSQFQARQKKQNQNLKHRHLKLTAPKRKLKLKSKSNSNSKAAVKQAKILKKKTSRKARKTETGKIGGSQLNSVIQLEEKNWIHQRPRNMMDINPEHATPTQNLNIQNDQQKKTGLAEMTSQDLNELQTSLEPIIPEQNVAEIMDMKPILKTKKRKRRRRNRRRKRKIM